MSRATQLWLCIRPVLLALVLANTSWSAAPPDSVTVELITDHWSGWLGRHQLDTVVVSVHTGQALPESLRDQRLEGRALRPVFVAGRIVAHDRLWIRLPLPVVVPRAAIGGLSYEARHDSVLVSTSRRHLGTDTKDAGVDYSLRVLPSRESSVPRDPRIELRVRGAGQLMGTGVWPSSTMAQGLFRLLEVHRDSVQLPFRRDKMHAVVGRFRLVERWGLPWSPPDTELVVAWEIPKPADHWALVAELVTRTRPGQLAVLQAFRQPNAPVWRGYPGESFAVVDSVHQMMWEGDFPYRYVHELRDAVRASCWPFEHPWLTRLVGHVETKALPRQGPPVRVGLRGSSLESIADSTGAFDLTGLPIGHGELEFRKGKRSWRALVELSDERLDTLEVVLH